MHTHITRMRHSKEGVQGLVAAFDGGEGDVDGQQWLNLVDLEIFGYNEKVRDVWVSVLISNSRTIITKRQSLAIKLVVT